MTDPVDLSLLIGDHENRWSDLLATMIATDPEPLQTLLGVPFDEVLREVVHSGRASRTSDRVDFVLRHHGQLVAVIEAKVLADLSGSQLARYQTAFPGAQQYVVLQLARFPVPLGDSDAWRPLTWEATISAYLRSTNSWVAGTARAWEAQLSGLVPQVGPATVWNALSTDTPLSVQLRARISWLYAELDSWCPTPHDLVQAGNGGNWVIRMWAPADAADHLVGAELQEGLSSAAWKRQEKDSAHPQLKGPVVLLGLRQEGVTTSAQFDWDLLRRLFRSHIHDSSGSPIDGRQWQRSPARPRDAQDIANWRRIVAAGSPPWLGKGFGMKSAISGGGCVFGARYQLRADSTLADISAELRQLQPLIVSMAVDTRPE